MSDIARDISLNGYENRKINLADEKSIIGDDCALLVVAGPSKDFSQKELSRLQLFLDGRTQNHEGGRVLVLLDSAELHGLTNLLSFWGVRIGDDVSADIATMSGADIVVTNFSPHHPITRPFENLQVLLEKPVGLIRSSAATDGSGADLKRYSALLDINGVCLAAVIERGSSGNDLAIRPSRLVVVGDVGFIMNGKLRSYANANRDFLLNVIKYLSGRDSMTSVGIETDRLVTGMDRRARKNFAFATSTVFPTTIFIVYSMLIAWRRRRR